MHRIGRSITVACGLALLAADSVAGQGAAGVDHTAVSPAQFDALVGLARQRLERALLIPSEDNEDLRRPLIEEAESFARTAAELRPAEPEGWFLVAASMGLRAEYESTRQRVRLGGDIWQMAATALELDPDHVGAHHVLGRLNLEAMSLSGFARVVAAHLYGSQVLRRAVELDPDALYHRLWLARMYRERGDDDTAREMLQDLQSRPAPTELDRTWQQQAAEDLEEL